MCVKKFSVLLLCIAIFTSFSLSQIRESGKIVGTVFDEEGITLSGITVTIEGPPIGPRSLITDAYGNYRFPSLPPGIYKITAHLEGFKTSIKEEIRLHTGMTLVIDFKMEVTKLAEEITVTAVAPMIDITESSVQKIIITDEFLESIPITQDYREIANLAPGITGAAFGTGNTATFSYQIDGIDITSPFAGDAYFEPNFRDIKEITVSSTGLPAEYGSFSGAVINVITKSGQNKMSIFSEIRYNNYDWVGNNRGKYKEEEFYDPMQKTEKPRTESLSDVNFNFGGPFIKDKLWWYVGAQYNKSHTYSLGYSLGLYPCETKSTYKNIHGKLTWEVNKKNKVSLHFQHSYRFSEHAYGVGSPYYSLEATGDLIWPQYFLSTNWTSIFGPLTYLEVKFGLVKEKYLTEPSLGRDVNARFDYDEYKYKGNFWHFREWDSIKINTSAIFSHHLPKFLGSHDLKIGFDTYSVPNYRSIYGYPGENNMMIYERSGVPFQAVGWAGYNKDHDLRYIGAFFQDKWSIAKRLTLNLGLRYENYKIHMPLKFNPELGSPDYKRFRFSPRIGFIYDLFGDKKTVLKFNFAQYSGKVHDAFMWYNMDTRGSEMFYYTIVNGEWVPFWGYDAPPEQSSKIDPDSKHPYEQEISLGVQREIFKNASLEVSYIHREIKRFWGPMREGAEYKQITVVEPGPDGIEGTADDSEMDVWETVSNGTGYLIYTNPSKKYGPWINLPYSKSDSLAITFNKRFSNNWQLYISYIYTKRKANVFNIYGGVLLSGYMGGPNIQVNPMLGGWNEPHQLKISGSTVLPFDINLSTYITAYSGNYWQRTAMVKIGRYYSTINAEPYDTRKYPGQVYCSLRLEKLINISKGKIGVALDFYNLFNDDASWVMNRSGGSFGKIYSMTSPRSLRFSLRYIY